MCIKNNSMESTYTARLAGDEDKGIIKRMFFREVDGNVIGNTYESIKAWCLWIDWFVDNLLCGVVECDGEIVAYAFGRPTDNLEVAFVDTYYLKSGRDYYVDAVVCDNGYLMYEVVPCAIELLESELGHPECIGFRTVGQNEIKIFNYQPFKHFIGKN